MVQVAKTGIARTVILVAVTRGYDWLLLIRVSVVVRIVDRVAVRVVVWVEVRVRVRGKKSVPKATPIIRAMTSNETIVPFLMVQRLV